MKTAIRHLSRLLLSKLMVLLHWHDRSFQTKKEKAEMESKSISSVQACQRECQQDKDQGSTLNVDYGEQSSQQGDNDQKIVMKNAISKIKSLVEDIDNKTDLLSFMDAKLTVLSMAENSSNLKSSKDRSRQESLMREKDHSRKAKKKKSRRTGKNTRSSSQTPEPPSSSEPRNN